MANNITFTKTLAAASANNIALSQSPGAGAITLNGSTVSGGVATIDTYNATTNTAPGRRVLFTSGGNDTGINFTVTGTNSTGNKITDTFAGASGAAAQSNLDFVTVTSVTHTGSVAGTLTIGTSAVGSSPWYVMNYQGNPPMNVAAFVQYTGTGTFTIEYTYDDPNRLPPGVSFPATSALLTPTALGGGTTIAGVPASVQADGLLTNPFVAIRLTINTGVVLFTTRILQAGIG